MDTSRTYHVGRECRDKLNSIIEYYAEKEDKNTLLSFIQAKVVDALTGIDQPAPAAWHENGFDCEFDIDHLCFRLTYHCHGQEYTNNVSLQKLLKAVYGVNDASVLAAVLTFTQSEHEALAIKIYEGVTDWLVHMRALCVTMPKLQK